LWDFQEVDHWGNKTWVECDYPSLERWIYEPYKWQLIGKPHNASLPPCDAAYGGGSGSSYSDAFNSSHVCGQTAHGEPLWYASLPVTYELWSVATGYLHVDAVVFLARGWYVYDGKNHSVYPGTVKFDISFFGYSFAHDGVAVQFEIHLMYPHGSTTVGNLTADEKDAVTTENNRLVASPRYVVTNGTLALSGKWRNASVGVYEPGVAGGPDLVSKFRFEGPFKHLAYDPVLWADADV